jgi:hypothetical protein
MAGVLAPDSVTSFLFLEDTVAKIHWDAATAVPSSMAVRQYSGVRPPDIDTFTRYPYFFADADAGSGAYNFQLTLYYQDHWTGTIVAENDVRLSQKSGSNPWYSYVGASSSVDTGRNLVVAAGLTVSSRFTITDQVNPLPVHLVALSARAMGKDVFVEWSTASEVNTNSFVVEVSADGEHFSGAGAVAASGTSNFLRNYHFVHTGAFDQKSPVLYYRIRTVDHDGSYMMSGLVSVKPGSKVGTTAYPNPFSSGITLNITGNGTAELLDIAGKSLRSGISLQAGTNHLGTEIFNDLQPGVYLLRLQSGPEVEVIRLLKN